MKVDSSVIAPRSTVLSTHAGLWWGLLGVFAFSFTLPFTRIAIGGLSPLFIGSGRAVVAALLAGIALAATRQRPPTRAQWARLAIVAGGVVAGFPLLTSFAMTTTPASHGAVVIGLLPAATAVAVVLRTRERPALTFWIFALLGAAAAVLFAALQNGGLGSLSGGDLLLFGAVVAAAIGYAEGGLLARELGAWQTISWALIVAAPLMAVLTVVSAIQQPPAATPVQWLAFAYLAAVSMFLGFFAWYRGLAIGPMAQVSQIQLVQPVMSIAWASILLHEPIDWATAVGGFAVIACAALAVRTRLIDRRPTTRRTEDS
ncbi:MULTISPECIES: DMT family transporter [unclassified Microbacterium]|uniref:DMT family transporter n=1 Tax=unclassified Microbacterium TaxID=2609290 RepID=UPI000CFAFB15|nr:MULTISPECIES: DMT family transporter [unclassified Microbacterium]PQZ55361.1 EamA family transporter [Microbacterium sp. MYb43]PQZ76413.1 EamA family transporter [Microbacterium sp. MYb40]PRB21141.1 EamA family transporter [Microbacterium sp. MYb54]PRB26323.1 EamA family transporter [Microbacterium sp. MYb50]PRB66962.1 EamA family transporter [Microbacterium sp. MYb24]